MAVPLTKHLMTVEEFQRAAAAGVFAHDNRLELIRGEIVEMSPIGDRHGVCVMLVEDLLADLRPTGMVSTQNSLRLPRQQSVPQPDVVLLRRRSDFGLRPPHPEDVLFLVEVAESSLAYDRGIKIPLYAESGIPEAWLVDLNSDTISVYRRPSPQGYQEGRQYRRGDTISPEAFPEARFSVDDLLP
jgi:Uma2 family endonuclease